MTDAMPIHPSSTRSLGTARMMIISIRRKPETIRVRISIGLEGTVKNSMAMSRLPIVRVVYEKSKNPEPRECIIGGLTKMDTSRSTHQRKVMMMKRVEK